MGPDTTGLFIRNRTAEHILDLVSASYRVTPTGRINRFAQAANGPADHLYLGTDGQWTHLLDASLVVVPYVDEIVEMDGRNAGILHDTTVLAIIFSNANKVYAFWLYERAKLVRGLVVMDGETIRSTGEPLAVERDVDTPEEGPGGSLLRAVFTEVTGYDGLSEFGNLRYAEYRIES